MKELMFWILFIVMILVLAGSCFMVGVEADKFYDFGKKVKEPVYDVKEFEDCKNDTVMDTAYCLRNYVKGFYNYTVRDDTEKTLEDIKQNGGDCYDYAVLYASMFNSLGFETEYLIHGQVVDTEGNLIIPAHRWTVAWDNTTVCEVDQLSIECYDLEVE